MYVVDGDENKNANNKISIQFKNDTIINGIQYDDDGLVLLLSIIVKYNVDDDYADVAGGDDDCMIDWWYW